MDKDLMFRKAEEKDLPDIWSIISAAKQRMKDSGRSQWQGEYPCPEDIARDISAGTGHVMECGGRPAGYCAAIFDGEPAYEKIEGRWLCGGKYVTVHRMAVAEKMLGKGLSKAMFAEIEAMAAAAGIRSFRADTNHDNVQMIRILDSLGFVRCGTVRYDGEPRIAYEKPVTLVPDSE